MLFKSPIIAQGSGSLAGTTYSHNRYGMYMRNRSTPVNPQTAFQSAVRNAFQTLTSAWMNTLTAVQRAAWDVYAANVSVPNALGDPVFLTGLAHYVRSNVPRIQAGLARVDTGPTTFTLPETDPAYAVSASEATQLISVAFDDTLDWCDEDDAGMLISDCRPQNASINYFGGPFRFLDSIDGDSGTPPTTPNTFTANFAFVAGQKLFTRARISLADGRLSSPFLASLTAAA